MRGGYGSGISGDSPNDSAWACGRGATELENPGHRGWAIEISNGLPVKGKPVELPGEGMPGPSGDKYGNADSLPAPACPRHRGNSGRGKPPHPRCALCDMLVPRRALNGRHPTTAQCARGAERKRRRLAESDMRKRSERAFEAYAESLENVPVF